MIYDRAKLMYSQLRDVMGDSAFLAFTHDYYTRWALKHVDELRDAHRGGARVSCTTSVGSSTSGCTTPGLMDYSLDGVQRDHRWRALRDHGARASRGRAAASDAGGSAHGVGVDDWPDGCAGGQRQRARS